MSKQKNKFQNMPIPLIISGIIAAVSSGVAAYKTGEFIGSFIDKRAGGHSFSIENNTKHELWVAFHYHEDGKWITKKWFTVEPYSKREIIDRSWQFQNSVLYWHACTKNDSHVWEDTNSGTSEYFDGRRRYFNMEQLGFFETNNCYLRRTQVLSIG